MVAEGQCVHIDNYDGSQILPDSMYFANCIIEGEVRSEFEQDFTFDYRACL